MVSGGHLQAQRKTGEPLLKLFLVFCLMNTRIFREKKKEGNERMRDHYSDKIGRKITTHEQHNNLTERTRTYFTSNNSHPKGVPVSDINFYT